MAQHVYDAVPKKTQDICRAESQYGALKSCAQMLYMVFQLEGPGNLADRDACLRRLRSPCVCTDPTAALAELRRWYALLARTTELGLQMPDIQELYRACTSIYESVFNHHADQQVSLRWNLKIVEVGGQHVQTYAALRSLNDFARAQLETLIISGQHGSSTALPLTDSQLAARGKVRGDNRGLRLQPQASAVHTPGVAGTVNKDRARMSSTHAWWAPLCKDWESGCCKQGVNCPQQHPGFRLHDSNGVLVNRCYICGQWPSQ